MTIQEQVDFYFGFLVKQFEQENAEEIALTGEIPDYYLADIMDDAVILANRPY